MSGAARVVAGRLLVRPALVLLLAVVWMLPWAEVQGAGTGGLVAQRGMERTGWPALAAIVLLWSLGLAALGALRPAALRAGEAFAAAALCGASVVVLALGRLPGTSAAQGEAWLAVFAPLGLIALLEGAARLSEDGAAAALGAVRCASAAWVAVVLGQHGDAVAAGVAAWLAAAPLAFAGARDAHGARRAVEILVLAAALLAGFAPALGQRLWTSPAPVGGIGVAAVGWSVLAALVVLVSTAGVLAPREPA